MNMNNYINKDINEYMVFYLVVLGQSSIIIAAYSVASFIKIYWLSNWLSIIIGKGDT